MEPQMDTDERGLETGVDSITSRIIGCAYTVSNVMGCGFLEKVYENALAHEMTRNGLDVEQQYEIPVWYDDKLVGEYVADLLVEKRVLVELKAVKDLNEIHMAQCLNYLNATMLHVCLLLNFGNPRVQVKRIVRNLPDDRCSSAFIGGSYSEGGRG